MRFVILLNAGLIGRKGQQKLDPDSKDIHSGACMVRNIGAKGELLAPVALTLYDEVGAAPFDYGPDKMVIGESLDIFLPGRDVKILLLAACGLNSGQENKQQDYQPEAD